ncbi:MAG: B12-binding domain-containing radical SAM protein [Candidatus Bathyarchaeota archaeon]|nr:B12-binding domain-containing radical SAM protein [Candidatus Bathyarchaeota archaeon]
MILLMTTAPPEKSPWGMAGKLPPLGLAYVAAALRKNGYAVEIYDNYLMERSIEEVKAEIRRRQPEIVGITCSSLTYTRCVETAKAAKEAYSACKIVVGGPHPSYMPQTMLEHKEIDYVVLGEGEQAMTQLAESILRGRQNNEIGKIPGVACKVDDEISKVPPEFINDLDVVPFPARDLLPMKMYDRTFMYLDVKPVDTMSILRGCPYQCAYCETRELWGTSCRAFSPQRVIAEIKHMVENYGSRGIYFVGDNFTINKKRTQELCRLIKTNKIDIKWTCETRVDLVDKELLFDMKLAGCQTIFFGVESGSPRIQQKLNKNIDLQEVKRVFELCRQVVVRTATSFMLGIPGETVEDMKATFKFAKSLNADWCQFNIYIACPGSKLYDEVVSQGLYDQMDNYLARVKTEDFDYDLLVKIQKDFQRNCQKSASRLIRVIRQEGIGSAVRKGAKLIFH